MLNHFSQSFAKQIYNDIIHLHNNLHELYRDILAKMSDMKKKVIRKSQNIKTKFRKSREIMKHESSHSPERLEKEEDT